ncbi:hypothetical protein [Synergistes jonesii]|uniref:hypothetical protein n=1 Tax=Synergistes jonesii TaxID=2754 RepID=UPI00242C3C78|nr:hypothetical protein [Synergistes jonesii]
MAKTSRQYKELSIKEFTKAASKYESDSAGVYKLCRHDYPERCWTPAAARRLCFRY